MILLWSFYNSSFVKFHDKKFGSLTSSMTLLYPILCYKEVCYKWISLYFCSSLSGACSGMDQMRDQGLVFVETVTKMLKRLLEYRHIIQDEIKDHRMSCIVNLLVCNSPLCYSFTISI